MNTIMQLKKICNHPYMFQHIEVRADTNWIFMLILKLFIEETPDIWKNISQGEKCVLLIKKQNVTNLNRLRNV